MKLPTFQKKKRRLLPSDKHYLPCIYRSLFLFLENGRINMLKIYRDDEDQPLIFISWDALHSFEEM